MNNYKDKDIVNSPVFGHEKILSHSYFVKGIQHDNFIMSER